MPDRIDGPWHVVTMDHYVAGPFLGKGGLTAARDEARARADDPRKGDSGFKRYPSGSYEHQRYRGFDGERWPSFWLVTTKQLPDWPAAHAEYLERKKDA